MSFQFCIFSVSFSQDSQELLCGANDGFIYLYDRFLYQPQFISRIYSNQNKTELTQWSFQIFTSTITSRFCSWRWRECGEFGKATFLKFKQTRASRLYWAFLELSIFVQLSSQIRCYFNCFVKFLSWIWQISQIRCFLVSSKELWEVLHPVAGRDLSPLPAVTSICDLLAVKRTYPLNQPTATHIQQRYRVTIYFVTEIMGNKLLMSYLLRGRKISWKTRICFPQLFGRELRCAEIRTQIVGKV